MVIAVSVEGAMFVADDRYLRRRSQRRGVAALALSCLPVPIAAAGEFACCEFSVEMGPAKNDIATAFVAKAAGNL